MNMATVLLLSLTSIPLLPREETHMDAAQVILGNPSQDSVVPILAGSFRSLSLFLLAFTYAPNNGSSISLIHQTDTTFGPHQYIALNARRDRAYTTSWGSPPILSSWEIAREQQIEHWRVSHVNNAPITATSSYIALTPPNNGQHIYSMGGPTGEVHAVDPKTGGFEQKMQEVLFVEDGELEKADKTRKALVSSSALLRWAKIAHQTTRPARGLARHRLPTQQHAQACIRACPRNGRKARDNRSLYPRPRHRPIVPPAFHPSPASQPG